MTRKERNKHYKTVHRKFQEGDHDPMQAGFCDMSADIIFNNPKRYSYIAADLFPEYFLFKPEGGYDAYWFATDKEARLIALEFCIVMTEGGKND